MFHIYHYCSSSSFLFLNAEFLSFVFLCVRYSFSSATKNKQTKQQLIFANNNIASGLYPIQVDTP